MMGFGNHGFGMGGGGGFTMLLFWAVVIVAVVFGVRYFTGVQRKDNAGTQPDPRGILRERYARGEITTEEFEERLKVLEQGR